jgi:hypothetical protein
MRKFVLNVATAGALALALAACGGGSSDVLGGSTSSSTSGTSGTGGTGTSGTSTYSMGNGTGSSFQSGAIGLSNASIAAGGTTSLSITIVDQTGTLYTSTTAVAITLNSPCIAQGLATITPSGTTTAGSTADTLQTSTGEAQATYTAQGCSGADVISAAATVNSTNLTATATVNVAAAAVGSLQFVSATPTTIGLKGTGLNETSTVVFKVVNSSGGPRPGATVNFALNSTVGGLSLAPTSATSAADGTVQTVVSSGTAHTSVVVTASIAQPALSTQSSQLTVTTGLPSSNNFSIAVGPAGYSTLACPNVEAYGTDGVIVPVTVRLADRYANPAPNGTAVAFTANGGIVQGNCSTPSTGNLTSPPDGTCTVNWTSANPRPQTTSDSPPLLANGRVTVLATAVGEESFTDLTGSGFYQSGDPFQNLGEPYADDNENGVHDPLEYFLDYEHTGTYEGPPSPPVFKGITCTPAVDPTSCSTTTLAIGASHLIIMSTSQANIQLVSVSGAAWTATTPPLAINASSTGGFTFSVQDLNGNPVAAGTTIAISADSAVGTINSAQSSYTMGCSTAPPSSPPTFASSLTSPATAASGNIYINVTSPGTKTLTTLTIPVMVN